MSTPAIAIFDIGKTNKKFFLFDQEFNELHHEYMDFEELDDDDGDPCDDLAGITKWMLEVFDKNFHSEKYDIKKLNFSTYGASLVHLGSDGKPLTALYNYLKPFPELIEEKLFQIIDIGKNDLETASPYLGMLNSALQLFWLKEQKKSIFDQIKYSLHLPQYFSYLFTGQKISELTSVGCHTKMWDFVANNYHPWLKAAGLQQVLPEVVPVSKAFSVNYAGKKLEVGVGIHDSSSALAPYLIESDEPFLLISTGTWSITLNPFTSDPLTNDELNQDCLNYINIYGKPVKAARLFLGSDFQAKVKILNELFSKDDQYYKTVKADRQFFSEVKSGKHLSAKKLNTIKRDRPQDLNWSPGQYASFEEAYHHLNLEMALLQCESIALAKGRSPINKIFLDGGFIFNDVFIQLLRALLAGYQLEISSRPNGSALGAAMVMSQSTTL